MNKNNKNSIIFILFIFIFMKQEKLRKLGGEITYFKWQNV